MNLIALVSIGIAALSIVVAIDDRIGPRERMSWIGRELLMGVAVLFTAIALLALTLA